MPTNILMPALSPTMTEGNLAKWHKQAGDTITAGDVIAEIETDKATMEVEAVDEGILGKILVAEGSQGVKVNEVIAVLLAEGESASDISTSQPAATPAASAPPSAKTIAPANDSQQAASKTAAPATGNRIFITPLAKRIASQNNVDIQGIQGSGPNGRIVKADVDATLKTGLKTSGNAGKAPASANTGTALAIDAQGMPPYEVQANSTMRKVIARRLTESKQQVPHFYLTVDTHLDALLALRKQINNRENASIKLSVNDFIIKACALALREVPAANASWTEEGIRLYNRADVSVAVAIDGGLITPIIRGACSKKLTDVSSEMKELAGKARAGKLKPEEFTGGTFSISNLGMFGIKNFNAIVNPPQGCILAVGAGEERAVVKNGQLQVGTVMSCTLSVDHRVVDGAVGAEFLAAFKRLIEDPLGIIL